MSLHDLIALPRTELCVSPLALGTAGLGVGQFEHDAHALLDRYVALGGNFIDTARGYSDWVPGEIGRAERILGDWLVRRKKGREHLVIATKGCHPGWSGAAASRLNRDAARRDLDASLRALGTDYVDLFHVHSDDPRTPVEEVVDWLQAFRREGKVRHFAVSGWCRERLDAANRHAAQHEKAGFVAHGIIFNLGCWSLRREAGRDCTGGRMDAALHDFHRRGRLAVLAFSPQGGGFFARAVARGVDAWIADEERHATPANRALVRVVAAMAEAKHTTASGIVLAYLLHQAFPVIPVIGCRNVRQLEDCAGALSVHLTPEEMRRLSETAGAPGAGE